MTKNRATVLGIFFAPIVPAAFFAWETQIGSQPDIIEKLEFFPIYYFFAMVFMGVFGIPLILIGFTRNLVRWWSAASAGACVGAIFGASFNQHGEYLAMPCALGAATGLTWWLVWRLGKDEPAPEKSGPPTADSRT